MNGMVQMGMRRVNSQRAEDYSQNKFFQHQTTEYDYEADLELTWIGDAMHMGMMFLNKVIMQSKNNLKYYLDLPYGDYMATQ